MAWSLSVARGSVAARLRMLRRQAALHKNDVSREAFRH